TEADVHRPVYSPDGARIVYGLQREIDFYADRVRIVAYDRRTRRHDVLTEGWDRSAVAWEFGTASETLFLSAETEGRMGWFRLEVPSSGATPKPPVPREIHRGGWLGTPRPAGGRLFSTI